MNDSKMPYRKYPNLSKVVHTEFAMLLLVYVPILMTIIGYIVLLYKHFPYENIKPNDVHMFMFFWVVSLCGMPFVIWWYSVIKKTFLEGYVIDAKVKPLRLKAYSTEFVIEYEFMYKSEIYNHYSNLIVNNKTKILANQKVVKVIFNPKSKFSFLLDAYNAEK